LSAIIMTPAVAIRMKEKQPEQGSLHRLGLDVRVDHDERAVVHGGEHECGRGDLCERAIEHPGPENGRRARQRLFGCDEDDREEHQRERKTEQEAHVRRPDRAECHGELALGGVAHRLACRGDNGEDGPEPAHETAFSATTM
jgi:hypothetical protein